MARGNARLDGNRVSGIVFSVVAILTFVEGYQRPPSTTIQGAPRAAQCPGEWERETSPMES